MGEYTTRKSDNAYIKIGTCNAMYYLRWDDIDKVNSPGYDLRTPGIWFRLPFPDEDALRPGDGYDYNRATPLIPYEDPDTGKRIAFDIPDAEHGLVQMHHKGLGMLLNINCYHGSRLPDSSGEIRVHGNGRSSINWELYMVKNHDQVGLLPIVRCMHCGDTHRATWAAVLPHVQNSELRARLTEYAAQCKVPALEDQQ